MHGRKMFWPRGKIMGGCSSINAMVYHRCPPADYDYWESLGNAGWAFNDLLPYFKKAEKFHSMGNHVYNRAVHGHSGPWKTSYPPASEIAPLSHEFVNACDDIGIHVLPDFNDHFSVHIGSGMFQRFTEGGERSSASSCYLPEHLISQRGNLTIGVNAVCTKILTEMSDEQGQGVRAVGVEFAMIGTSKICRHTLTGFMISNVILL